MAEDDFPAVTTMNVTGLRRNLSRVWAELESGAVVRIVYTTGAARAWLTPEPPPGSAPVRISMSVLRDHLGEVLDRARDGEVFEVADTRGIQPGNVSAPGRVHGYLAWEPPEALKRQPGVLQFYVKSRAGRLLLREFASATATEARRA